MHNIFINAYRDPEDTAVFQKIDNSYVLVGWECTHPRIWAGTCVECNDIVEVDHNFDYDNWLSDDL